MGNDANLHTKLLVHLAVEGPMFGSDAYLMRASRITQSRASVL